MAPTTRPMAGVAEAEKSSPPVPAPPRWWWAREDWLAVWLGAIALGLIMMGSPIVMPGLKWGGSAPLSALFTSEVIIPWIAAGGFAWLLSLPAVALLGADVGRYSLGFAIVFALAWLSLVLAGNATSTAWGFEYVIFALALGLLVSHLGGGKPWLLEAARTELFIKIGLVIMGATILFAEVLQAGVLGLVQAIGVVIVVWYVAYWLARKFRVDDELAVMISTAVSICGVSAAIAACGAIQGDRRKLSYVTSLVLIVAVPMIVLMPWVTKVVGIPDTVAGAWLGGTLDTTGSVVAAGALISETSMKVGTIVKFSQNVLIGVAAFILSMWWTMRQASERADAPGAGVIWERFPKFVLGFLAASIVFSFFLSPEMVARTRGAIGSARTVWFALAFVSIGLETRVTDLFTLDEGRPLVTFVLAQAFNVAWTLLLAWLIFGGILFSSPAI
jgi:uncharacterized membrane protein YadS